MSIEQPNESSQDGFDKNPISDIKDCLRVVMAKIEGERFTPFGLLSSCNYKDEDSAAYRLASVVRRARLDGWNAAMATKGAISKGDLPPHPLNRVTPKGASMSRMPIELSFRDRNGVRITLLDVYAFENAVVAAFEEQVGEYPNIVPMLPILFHDTSTAYGKICDNDFRATPTGVATFSLVHAMVRWAKDLHERARHVEKTMKNFSVSKNEEVVLFRLNAMWINALLNRLCESKQFTGFERQLFIHLYDGAYPHPNDKLILID